MNKLANQFYKLDENIENMLKKGLIKEEREKCSPDYITSLPYDNRTHDPLKLSERQQAIETEIKKTDKQIKKLETQVSNDIHDLERSYKNLILNTRRLYPRSQKPSIFFDNTPQIEKTITKITNEGSKEIQDQYIKLMNNVGDLYNDMKKNLVGKDTGEPYIINYIGNKQDIFEVPPSSQSEFKLTDAYLQKPNLHEKELNNIEREIDNFNKISLNYFGLESWSGAKGDAKTVGSFAKDLISLKKTINNIRKTNAKNTDKFKTSSNELLSQNKKKTNLENELNKIS